jgi:hypothetical protein
VMALTSWNYQQVKLPKTLAFTPNSLSQLKPLQCMCLAFGCHYRFIFQGNSSKFGTCASVRFNRQVD